MTPEEKKCSRIAECEKYGKDCECTCHCTHNIQRMFAAQKSDLLAKVFPLVVKWLYEHGVVSSSDDVGDSDHCLIIVDAEFEELKKRVEELK